MENINLIKNTLTSDQLQIINNALKDKNLTFFFIPSADFKNMIASGKSEHKHMIDALPKNIITLFLEGHGIAISNEMVIKYINNELDQKNSFILSNGEIRVIGNSDFNIKKI